MSLPVMEEVQMDNHLRTLEMERAEAGRSGSPFHEALMRAWVQGWYAWRDNVKTDDGKRDAAEVIAHQFPNIVQAVNAHAALVQALKNAANELQQWHNDHPSTCRGGCPTLEIIAQARAALKLAEGE